MLFRSLVVGLGPQLDPRDVVEANDPAVGIGLQDHLVVGEVPSTIQANMERFTALGVEVAITELDIRMTLPETPALLEQQKRDYQTVISACNAVPGCIGITIWDYTDRVSCLSISVYHQ